MSEQEKVAQEVPAMMLAGARQLTKLASQNVELIKRAESAEHENRVMKLARRMEVRGLHPSLSFEEKVAQLGEVPVDRLATMEQAVELAAGGVRLGKVAEADTNSKIASGPRAPGESAADELETFIESQAALV